VGDHRGVNADDPRNAIPIDFFRPKKIEPVDLRAALSKIYKGDKLAAMLAEYNGKIAGPSPRRRFASGSKPIPIPITGSARIPTSST
jgi:hypothetical protein